MKKTIILMILMMVCFVQAANFYVSETDPNANDSNAGTSAVLPKKTIASAYTASSDGDVIYVMSNLTSQGQAGTDTWQLILSTNDKDVDIQAYNDVPCTITFGHALIALYMNAHGSNLTIGRYVTLVSPNASVLFTKTTNSGTPEGGVDIHGTTYGAYDITDLAYIRLHSTAKCYNLRSGTLLTVKSTCQSVLIDEGALLDTSDAASAVGVCILINSTCKLDRLIINGATIDSCIVGVKFINTVGAYSTSKTIIDIRNSTITAGNNSAAIGAGLENTDATTWATGQTIAVGNVRFYKAVMYQALQAIETTSSTDEPGVSATWETYWKVFSAYNMIVDNCIINGHSGGHSVAMLYGNEGSVIRNCIISGGNAQVVVKGDDSIIVGNTLTGARPLFVSAKNVKVYNNTIVASDNTNAAVILAYSATGYNNWNTKIYDNIIVQTGTSYLISNTANTVSTETQFDNNCYYKSGAGDWFYWNSAAVSNFAAWQTVWANSIYGNDLNSLVVNPQFRNAAGGDYTPLNRTLGTAGSNGQYIGAKDILRPRVGYY